MIRSLKRVFTFLFVFLICGCSIGRCSARKDIPPEDQLHAYISRAIDVTKMEQRQELVDLTTGALRSALINASDESFKKAYIDKHYDFKAFEIVSKNEDIPGERILIDFRLLYKSWNAGEQPDRVPVVDTKNRATLVYEHGRWAIFNVESLESTMDWEVGLPLDNVSTKGVDENTPPVEVDSSRSIEP